MLWIRTNVKNPWPVHITHRHTGEVGTLQLTTDDMLLYAGRASAMGMPEALDGDGVVAVYVHYAPENRDECIIGNCQYCGTTEECSLPDPLPSVY